MFNKKDRVIVAVSGGPDSISLLHILYNLKDELEITLYAAHVNHCLRGKEADADEEYVRNFCRNYSIEFRSKRINIDEISKIKNISHESAGREARYEFFEEFRKEVSAQKIAIAHNSNDQAETILMRIMRGSGTEGLTGIKPVRDNIFVRPLINNSRDEIEKYCRENNLQPRIDKTNLEAIYSRNKIRLQLIPYMQEHFNKDIVQILNRLSDTIKVDNDYLEIISKEKYKKYCDVTSEKVIISKKAFLEHDAILTRIIRLAIYNIEGNLYNVERVHIYDIIHIQKQHTGKMTMLPNNLCAINNYSDIYICKKENRNKENNSKEYMLHNGVNILQDINLRIKLSLIDKKVNINVKGENLIKYFDYDKIKKNISLRYRKEGDKFIPLGMKGSKKLKDFFIDLKIPKDKRDEIPIICFGDKIAWIVGYRVSDLFKVDKNTQTVLEVRIESEEL